MRFDRHAEHRQRRQRRHHAGQMRGAAGAGDDDFEAAPARRLGIGDQTVRRAVRGIPMRLSLKVSEFLGVVIRVIPPDENSEGAVAVMLEHRDQGLSVPLMVATGAEGDVVAEWQRWARVLGRPLLIADGEGYREPFARIGAVRVREPQPRRRRRGALRGRRPSILMRRKPGRARGEPRVHRDEREIVARN